MGIIPAYAGNTKDYREHAPHVWDHPRVCGEHHMTSIMVHLNWGSSPRMRGTPTNNNTSFIVAGIIPAYAGNTCEERRRCGQDRDHPRVCGEHDVCNSGLAVNQGSSPRMRGTRRACTRRTAGSGIIPAYAGNTCVCGQFRNDSRDHPRVCGEHSRIVNAHIINEGSSPRMRGTLRIAVLELAF